MQRHSMNIDKTMDAVLAARKVATPIIAIETSDPGGTTRALSNKVIAIGQKKDMDVPVYQWDASNGLRPWVDNDVTTEGLTHMLKDYGGDPMATMNPSVFVSCIKEAPKGSVIVAWNIHRFWEESRLDPSVVQGLWNVRDIFKTKPATLVLTMPDCELPPELRHDVVVFTEALPDPGELRKVVSKVYTSANLPSPSNERLTKAVHILSGLSAYEAEQVTYMALTEDEEGDWDVSLDALRSKQRQQIELTPGLEIWDGQETFGDLKGLNALTGFLKKVIKGKRSPRAFVFIDEIEKMLAGALGGGSDTSGTSQEQLGYLLSEMQDTNARGVLLVGTGGTGKSAIGKACGNEGDCWTIGYDVGATKGSLVGETGAMTRRALRVIDSIGQGETFWIATCNRIESIPPELRRRFSYGTWYLDLPTKEARADMWEAYGSQLGVSIESLPNDEGWTGAEIKTCVGMAKDMSLTIEEAGDLISPVSRTSAESIEALRRLANGRFKCATTGDNYKAPEKFADKPSGVLPLGNADTTRILDMNES